MIDVPVALNDRSYRISIGSGLLATAGERLAELTRAKRIPVVTDAHVADRLLPKLTAGLDGFEVVPIVVAPGEPSKSFGELERLVDALLGLEVKRSDVVLALGGGVIGDLTGFAASIVKRGMNFIQVPTSLLAMVDSSVGGKTGINTPRGKNLVGAFHQPLAVWADLDCLATLPEREMRAGYAEVVKYGLIGDPAFYIWCEANAARLLAGDREALAHAVAQSCRAKAAIVAADERETGDIRALLNLGHTFGHALEAETGFSSRLLHGEAVAIGMAQALRFSAARGLCAGVEAERLTAHLASIGMMAWAQQAGIAADAAPRLVAHMLQDKKMTDAGLPFILARSIGDAFVAKDVPLEAVTTFLDADLKAEYGGRSVAA
ncbi:3-dehydroquinate synthase [Sandaracinobacter sp. RS1-74]|uniref:3-dehydroquinate synthase n=1 Tax=Sandaracinobacteroides sayramensis TaxID=2913411 RepID=UPI001EDA7F46|nr:3-dehydroquinate synthase [Sandaracinobacteroides sayramensis]MCG2840350.1 3-dehydroquinate synthase [Sandaracinobacteroides sayramensis]